ncbi:4Fe-4S dicluster domain-containing protein [Aporhodopirellula aestuarii]|uniref:4Fe-4S dicluster domain-containing protein n=1 Tax=Aporhodopirellula aestuarii TaxID=2950107 RepID=A0ABT0TYP2_9BACT|nr:4Fe-4S dicluster domain-containing protein [Aporhodopirellula aestuarii]MCM2369712.1 4Fe-4S dicluster domain-containing protein [Aporhodopirellula aestuarii]
MKSTTQPPAFFLPREELQILLDQLVEFGYDVVGPTVQQGAVVYRSVRDVAELPRGWTDHQEPAVYELQHDPHDRLFRFNSSPDSWKRFFFPSSSEIGTATLTDDGWIFKTPDEPTPRYALLGVRACDLAAIAVQDRVFRDNEYVDAAYRRRREAAFIVAVNCVTAANTCFCNAMDTGPNCENGFDLVLTETADGFVIHAGSQSGRKILSSITTTQATPTQIEESDAEVQNARDSLSKQFDKAGVHDLLLNNLEHPRWAEVAERCLSCANCTMVCPTCFCSTVDEVANLSNTEVSRVRQWDSCFNIDFSHTAGGVVRNDIRSRYRQWLIHKMATWEDQFDVSGCVGCGRCITWCPVGIDLTDEVAALRETVTT